MGLLDALRDPQFRSDLGTNARQLGQSASNTIAEGVTMPVDAIAWLLRRGRVPVPENPIGGSDWAKQMGLMADVPQGAPKIAGETLGLLAPMAGTKQGVNAMATALRQGGENLAARRTMNPQSGAIVWHGSPHKFDKFDASKIGTGEGAQAYGHGLYLAESPDVAQQYQKTLAADGFLVGDKVFDPSSLQHLNVKSIARKGDIDAAIAKAQEIANSSSPVANMAAQDLARLREIKAAGGLQQNTGSLYKVDLPDEQIARMLDWDKPLSKQSKEVKRAIEKTRAMLPPNAMDDLGGDLSLMYGPDVRPQDFLNTWESFGQKAGGENALRQLGVPGVRYLDGGSRGAGQGSSNFVVFPGNENMLQILERNGQPLGLLK